MTDPAVERGQQLVDHLYDVGESFARIHRPRDPSELELARMRRNRPCRVCGGSGAASGPDHDGQWDTCEACSGSGIEGGV